MKRSITQGLSDIKFDTSNEVIGTIDTLKVKKMPILMIKKNRFVRMKFKWILY